LPEIYDPNLDSYSVSLKSDFNFITLSESSSKILIDLSKVSKDLQGLVTVILKDSLGAKNTYKIFLNVTTPPVKVVELPST
jgi:hypothetical protein